MDSKTHGQQDDAKLAGQILDSIKSMEPVNGIDQYDFFQRLPISAERKNGVLAAFWRTQMEEEKREKNTKLTDENFPALSEVPPPPALSRDNSVGEKWKHSEAKEWGVPISER